MTPPAEAVQLEEVERFRMVLAEHDIVVTGIRTLIDQLSKMTEQPAPVIGEQLRAIQAKYGFDSDAMWLLEVADQSLLDLLAELRRRGRDQDPVALMSAQVAQLKSVLSPLSHAVEIRRDRSHVIAGDIHVADNTEFKRENVDRMAYELAFGRSRLNSRPLRHVLDTTSRCNFRCLTCHQSETQDVIHYDLADAQLETLKSAFPYANQLFIAGMGEPLLSRSAFDLVSSAKASGAFVEAITNGTTLARGSRLLPVIDMLMVSMDGGTAEAYDTIRRNGSFDRMVADLQALSDEARGKVCFNVVVCKQNIFTMPQLVALACALGIGHVHLQEMYGYLPWHDRMLIDEADRTWLFDRLTSWSEAARANDVSLICNLVPPAEGETRTALDPETETRRNIQAVSDVPTALLPARQSLEEASAHLTSMLEAETPFIFRVIGASLRRLAAAQAGEAGERPTTDLDWNELRDYVDDDQAQFPHCMSTFAQLVVNGDGTTRSCCKVQSRLSVLDKPDFDDIWNGAAYTRLRSAHVAQETPRDACRECRDPVRFHFVIETLEALVAHDIDISLIRKPKDFPVPSSMADHPLVQRLGKNALEA